MKSLIFATLFILSAIDGFAQGTVIFNNRLGATSHVWASPANSPYLTGASSNDNPSGPVVFPAGSILIGANGTGGRWGAATTLAQLLAAPGSNAAETSLLPSSSPPTSFRTGAAAGNVAATTATLTGVPLDAPVATLEMAVWDNTSGLYPTWAQASVALGNFLIFGGRSAPFIVNSIGGQGNPAPTLDNLRSFNIVESPEPSSLALSLMAALGLIALRRLKIIT